MPDRVGLGQHEPTSMRGIATRARTRGDHRFQKLYRELDAGLLHACWRDLNKRAASGVDRVTTEAYERDLDANIQRLAERLKAKSLMGLITISAPVSKSRSRFQFGRGRTSLLGAVHEFI